MDKQRDLFQWFKERAKSVYNSKGIRFGESATENQLDMHGLERAEARSRGENLPEKDLENGFAVPRVLVEIIVELRLKQNEVKEFKDELEYICNKHLNLN